MIVCIYDYQQTKQKEKKQNKQNKQLKESKMAETTEFIGGMEKIIAFIKSQSEKVKNLEGELCATNTALEMVKDENEVNKKNMMKFMKENKELKQENKKLKEEIKDWRVNFKEETAEKRQLKVENAELEEKITELEEELAESEEGLDNQIEIKWQILKKIHDDKEKIHQKQKKIHDDKEKIHEELVKELKKENAELKEKITCLESDSHNEVSQAEYDELKDEFDMYKEATEKQIRIEFEEKSQLEMKLEEQRITIDCHCAELEFIDGNALEEPDAFNDWLKRHYEEKRYKEIYEALNMCEFINEEE